MNAEKILIRHTSKVKAEIGLQKIEEKDKQFLIEKIMSNIKKKKKKQKNKIKKKKKNYFPLIYPPPQKTLHFPSFLLLCNAIIHVKTWK